MFEITSKIRHIKGARDSFKSLQKQNIKIPEILSNYFKDKTRNPSDSLSDYFKNETQAALETLSDHFKNKIHRGLPKFFQITSETRPTGSPRDSFKLLQNQTQEVP
mgnify:FL=1